MALLNPSVKPTPAMIKAAIRQWAGYIGSGLAALGLFPGVTEYLSALSLDNSEYGIAGIVAVVVAFVWGQVATRKLEKSEPKL